MILIVNICKEKLHYYEFVKPIEDILKKDRIKFYTINYHNLDKEDIKKAEKIIICGTSLKDNHFVGDIDKFYWLKEYNKPVLGICGGMQIISVLFEGKLNKKIEIGFYEEEFNKEFLGLIGKQKVYHLHNNCTTLPKDFEEFTGSEIPQAVKHISKPIYGVLFHPEVRNKQIIINFALA